MDRIVSGDATRNAPFSPLILALPLGWLGDSLVPLSGAGDRSAAGSSNDGPLGHPATAAVSPSASQSTTRLATGAGERQAGGELTAFGQSLLSNGRSLPLPDSRRGRVAHRHTPNA